MRGRPRKPLDAKVTDGTYRKDRDGPAAAAVRADGVPVKPLGLNALASDLWGEVVPGLLAQALVGERDTAALVSMCEWWACYRRNMDALSAMPEAGLATPAARVLQIAAAEASRQFQLFACRFGLTPADRAKLRAEPVKKQQVASRPREG